MRNTTVTREARLDEFGLHTLQHTRWNRRIVTGVSIQGRTYEISPAFWRSLLFCFRIAPSAAEFVGDETLFQLLRETSPNRVLKYEVETDEIGVARLKRVFDPHLARWQSHQVHKSADSSVLVN